MKFLLLDLFQDNFMPHGHCYFWTPEILWPHAISDSIIALAYSFIPLSLIYIFKKRSDFKFVWIMILFAIFILGCGLTHVMDVINIWQPWYRLDNTIRAITALASIGTAIVLVKITPQIIKIPTAKQWEEINNELEDVNKELINQINELKLKDKTIEAFKQFESLTETLPQLVITTDPNGNVKFYNQRWYQFTGLPFEQSLYEALKKIVHPDYILQILKIFKEGFEEMQPFQTELLIKNVNGEYNWYLAKALPVDMNSKYSWIITATDIHEQRKYHEELENKNRQLHLINNDLDNFVYTASHDLKAPISNIEGLVLALKSEKSSNASESEKILMDHMDKTISRFKKTINELTQISKIQKDIEEKEEEIFCQEIIQDVINDFEFNIRETGAIINLNIQVPVLYFSKKNFRSILSNLISNSLKYKDHSRQLFINILIYSEANYTILKISDNGLGFNANQNKVFGMFKRFHDHVEGSGIGLYIVKKIIDNYGGKIEVDSEEGVGSTFKIYFNN
jgi:PAS domain S-box-containing protein